MATKLTLGIIGALALAASASGQVEVLGHQRINNTFGGFVGPLSPGQFFGMGVTSLGDVDDDGVDDIAVGSALEELWVLLLNPDDTVKSEVRIADGAGGFNGRLSPASQNFGWSVTGLGDLDLDGVPDLAVGAPSIFTCGGGCPTGSLWILFLNADGTVKAQNEISSGKGGLPAVLAAADRFGAAAAVIGDLQNDGTLEIAVGAPGDVFSGEARGAVYILTLQSTGNVILRTKIGGAEIGVPLSPRSMFGASLAGPGNIGNGFGFPNIEDLVVGAPGDDTGLLPTNGAIFSLLLNSNGTLLSAQKIFDHGLTSGGGFFAQGSDIVDFGRGVAPLGDVNGDLVPDVAVGSPNDDDSGEDHGAIWILYMDNDGTVDSQSKISDLQGCFEVNLLNGDRFGWSLARLPDQNGDGHVDLAAGAIWDGPMTTGAVYTLYLGDELQGVTTFRNAGSNPAVYTSDPPVLGSVATLTVNAGAAGHGNALPFGFDTPLTLPLANGATLLALDIGGNGELLGLSPAAGPIANFFLNFPNDESLCGLRIYSQALLFGTTFPFKLSNAQDWIVGH